MSGNTRWGKRSRHDDPDNAREHILQATYNTLTTKGVEKTTISEIAKQAKVSRPTIYRYFDSRETIIRSLIIAQRDRFFADMYQATLPYADGDFADLVVQCLVFGAEYHVDEQAHFSVVAGPNAGAIASFVRFDDNAELWRRILEAPYERHRRQGGPALELGDLIDFLGMTLLATRNYRISAQQLRRQLSSFLALGKR